MSFIRPEARQVLWRWREAMMGAAILCLGLYWVSGLGLVRWLGIAIALFGASLAWLGAQRARVRQRGGQAAGVIELDERQLSYMGPDGGAIVILETVQRIEIETNDRGPAENDMFWLFYQNGAATARIPANALGHDQLIDALAAFPGADFERVITASASRDNARFLIWQKELRRLH